jgi:hypothetical protein
MLRCHHCSGWAFVHIFLIKFRGKFLLRVGVLCAILLYFFQHNLSFCRVASHLFTSSLAGISKLLALAGWYIWYGMYGIFCTVRFGGSSILWNFAGTPLKRGAWSIKKGAEAREKGVPSKYTIPKRTNQVFLRYRLGKYWENTNRYQTKIPNWDATLKYTLSKINRVKYTRMLSSLAKYHTQD